MRQPKIRVNEKDNRRIDALYEKFLDSTERSVPDSTDERTENRSDRSDQPDDA